MAVRGVVEMKRVISWILALVMLFPLCACGQKGNGSAVEDTPTWQEQYDLGVRYLEEGNYEEAVIAFTAAIEIEEMKPEAYLALANVYIAQNKFDEAREILVKGYELTSNQSLQDKIDEINSGNIYDYWGQPHKVSSFDENGNLQSYHILEYDGQKEVSVTAYNAHGEQTDYWDDFRFDERGNCTRYFIYYPEEGRFRGYDDREYNEEGRCVRMKTHSTEGTLEAIWEFEYDEHGNEIRCDLYSSDGELSRHDEYTYDSNGRMIRLTSYDFNGEVIGYIEYEYDDNGKCIGDKAYDPDGTLVSSSGYE